MYSKTEESASKLILTNHTLYIDYLEMETDYIIAEGMGGYTVTIQPKGDSQPAGYLYCELPSD